MAFMRRFVSIVIILSLTLIPAAAFSAATGQEMSVQVRSTKVHSAPEWWSPAVTGVVYGDKVTIISGQKDEGGWLKVQVSGKEGYLHISALTSRTVVLKTGAEHTARAADASEVVLAGKGFSKELEGQYARSHSLSFAPVDQVEHQRVSEGELAAFVKAGKLGTRK
jgi:uncharacterized protein YgiM (DUF1202 family)